MRISFLIIFPALAIAFIIGPASAEYRAYQYTIRSKVNKSKDNQSYIVTSALHPVAYVAYHGGPTMVEATMLRTWMCPGHTGHNQAICKSPYEKALALREIEKEQALEQQAGGQ